MTRPFDMSDTPGRRAKSLACSLALTFFIFAAYPLSRALSSSPEVPGRPAAELALVRRAPENSRAAPASPLARAPSGVPSARRAAPRIPAPAAPDGFGEFAAEFSGAPDGAFELSAFSGDSPVAVPEGGFGIEAFGVSELDRVPRRLRSAVPEYPRRMLERGVEGDVVVSVFINPDGTAEAAGIESSTDPAFERAALDAVGKLLFEPPMRGGRPVRAKFMLPVPFRIREVK